ncbi:ROK family transcriptional regulator [Pseudonocardia hydrocarbonoxydans]|uniref:Xylose repressor n=1 Tax=Pseudonocardia hydrocarbonoxydans TaxID=76726 RepID=A0A4Y3WVY0_9PSEU|nr:ROK family transcriptional regulator [Pseudonocardia hydrocarbonoxydans]GEC22250.1 xylose repressor [Pseudonocardia hydrocarbonoxydans]
MRESGARAAGGDVRRHNLALVLGEVVDAEPVSRATIAARTGLTRGTVSSLVEELLGAGLLDELAAARGGPGRPANPLQLNRSGPAGLGIEIEVDHVAACVVDLTGAVRATARAASDHRDAPPGVALARATELARAVRAEAGLDVAGVAVAVPGVVGTDGIVVRAPNLPRWSGADVGPLLDGLPVTTANEADLAALAELWFADGPPDALYVSGGVGVGAGIVLGGRLFRGAGGRAGELGHVVVDPDGPNCRCGGHGCLEQVAGRDALLRAGRTTDLDALPAHVLDAAARALGVALAGAVNLLDVPVVVLGGIYPRLGEALRAAVHDRLCERVVHRSDVQVRLSALGPGGALRAAAATVVRQRLLRP